MLQRTWVRIGSLLVLLVGLAFGLRLGMPSVESEAAPREPPAARGKARDWGASGSPPDQSPADSPPRGTALRERSATDLALGPTPGQAEASYPFAVLWRAMVEQDFDEAVTARQSEWVRPLLSDHDVEYRFFDLRCTGAICRADLVFDDVHAARGLTRLRLPTELSLMAAPVETAADGSVRVIAYLACDGGRLEDILESNRDGVE